MGNMQDKCKQFCRMLFKWQEKTVKNHLEKLDIQIPRSQHNSPSEKTHSEHRSRQKGHFQHQAKLQ